MAEEMRMAQNAATRPYVFFFFFFNNSFGKKKIIITALGIPWQSSG